MKSLFSETVAATIYGCTGNVLKIRGGLLSKKYCQTICESGFVSRTKNEIPLDRDNKTNSPVPTPFVLSFNRKLLVKRGLLLACKRFLTKILHFIYFLTLFLTIVKNSS